MISSTPRFRYGRTEILTLALCALSVADMDGGGYATWPSLAALGLCMFLLVGTMARRSRLDSGSVPWLAAPFLALLMWVRFGVAAPIVVWPSVGLAILAVASALTPKRGGNRLLGLALFTVWLVTLILWVNFVPIHIDVISLVRDGALRWLHGHDPYTGRYPSTTTGARSLPYTYSPITFILAAPAAWFGNVRYANVTLAATCVGSLYLIGVRCAGSRPSEYGARILPLILAVPLMTVMVWTGWTEVYVLAPLALWLLLRGRHTRLAVGLLAVAIGAKFTLLPVLVPLFLWSPKMRREIAWAASAAGCFFYLPFIIWAGPVIFFHDTVGFFLTFPTIPNSLSLQSLLAYFNLPGPTVLVTGLVLVGAVVGLAFWRPRDLSDLLLASAAFTFLAFLVNRWAFFNYWALVAYVLVAAIVTTDAPEDIGWPRWLPIRRRTQLVREARPKNPSEVSRLPDARGDR